MKKVIALMLVAVLALAICGCKEQTAVTTQAGQVTLARDGTLPEVEGFQVGFARKNITPTAAVPISGITANATDRMSTTIHDTLYVSCTAITGSNGETVLLMSWDLQGTYANTLNTARSMISEQTGIPLENILMTAIHTHSGPAVSNKDVAYMEEYRGMLAFQTVEAAIAALEDRKPAELYYSQVETERMNFVRHYSYVDANGELQYFGDQYRVNNWTYNETTKHVTDADPTMYILRIEREGDKDLIMANWRAHPHLFTSSSSYRVSADFIGAFRTSIESMLDCEFVYYQGAAGNVNSISKLGGEARTTDYGEYGLFMAEYAIEAMKNETKLEDTTVEKRINKRVFQANHTEDHLLAYAQVCRQMWKDGYSNSECTAYGEPYGIYGPIHAGEIISKAKLGETVTSTLHAISLGDQIGIVTAPHELFDTNSMWLEGQSPYDITLTFGYTNGMNGYVPSAQAVEYGCYELNCTSIMPGSGEVIQEEFLIMLNDMYGA